MERRQDGMSQLTAALDRPPHLRVDVVKGAEGGTKRGGVVIRAQHLHCAPHTSRVPTLELVTPLGWAQEARRALCVALLEGASRRAERERRARSSARSEKSKRAGRTSACPSSTHYSSNTPLCSKGDETNSVRPSARAVPRTSALEMVPNTFPCSAPWLVPQLEPAGS